MASAPTLQPGDDELRAVYEQFDLDSSQVAMISDLENESAWIQSNVTMPVEA